MTLAVSADDSLFRQALENCAFPIADFDHRAHLRLAYVYLAEYDTAPATGYMRDTLLRLLQHHGIGSGKYHETLTRAWILAVRHFMDQTPMADCADDFIDRNPALLDSKIMLRHYSAQLIFSDQARQQFVAPDRAPIPAGPADS